MNYAQKQKKLNKKVENWEKEKIILLKKQELKEQKKEIKNKGKQQKRKLTTTKLLTFFLFINCTIIQLFTLYITWKQINIGYGADLTPLQMLITTVVGQVIVFAVYSLKSLKENTKGGIIYQTALKNYSSNYEERETDQEALG